MALKITVFWIVLTCKRGKQIPMFQRNLVLAPSGFLPWKWRQQVVMICKLLSCTYIKSVVLCGDLLFGRRVPVFYLQSCLVQIRSCMNGLCKPDLFRISIDCIYSQNKYCLFKHVQGYITSWVGSIVDEKSRVLNEISDVVILVPFVWWK
jgi:hypothetical protein